MRSTSVPYYSHLRKLFLNSVKNVILHLFVLEVASIWALRRCICSLTRGDALLNASIEFLPNVRILGGRQLALVPFDGAVESRYCFVGGLLYEMGR